jgi:hypothetical protein
MPTITAKLISRSGAMTAERNRQLSLLFAASLLIVAITLLSFPSLFFEQLAPWFRVADQALLALGIVGSFLRSKALRFAGWLGIVMFFVYAVFGSLPSVDHPALDSNGAQRFESWIWRPSLAIAFYAMLVVSFRRLAVKTQPR